MTAPARPLTPSAGRPGAAQQSPQSPQAPRPALRILVVDDDRPLREGCANILRMDGHEVVTFARGEDAIEAARRQHFDIALVDLYMTPVSGMDVLRAIHGSDARTLVVVMTGNPTVASSLDALRAGAWDYLPKPFSASHVQVLVGRAAHAVQAARAAAAEGGDAAAEGAGAAAGGGLRLESGRDLRPDGPAPADDDEETLIGESGALRQAIAMAKRVAAPTPR
jgi:CheY-like chemotaxis protein